jgi:hypothetical protein
MVSTEVYPINSVHQGAPARKNAIFESNLLCPYAQKDDLDGKAYLASLDAAQAALEEEIKGDGKKKPKVYIITGMDTSFV